METGGFEEIKGAESVDFKIEDRESIVDSRSSSNFVGLRGGAAGIFAGLRTHGYSVGSQVTLSQGLGEFLNVAVRQP